MKSLYSILAVGTLAACGFTSSALSYKGSKRESLDESLFATYALTAYQGTSSVSGFLNKEATQGDMCFDSFDNALMNGNVERALELMTSSSEIKDVITSIAILKDKVINGSFILQTSENVNLLKQFVAQNPLDYLAVREFLIAAYDIKGAPKHAELLLKVLGLLEPVKTLTEAWRALLLNNVEIDSGIEDAMDDFSQIVMSEARDIRSKKLCGRHWHGGAKSCSIGKDLPISLFLDQVDIFPFDQENEDTQLEVKVTSRASGFVDKEATAGDMCFDSFENALINGNLRRALELMTSSSEIKDVITSIKSLREKVIHRSFILRTSEDSNMLKQFFLQNPLDYLTVKKYFKVMRDPNGTAKQVALLLKVIGLLEPVTTLGKAWQALLLNNVEIDSGIKDAMIDFSQIVMSEATGVRSKKFCGRHWHSGAKSCAIGKDLPMSLLVDEVYGSLFEQKNEGSQSEEGWWGFFSYIFSSFYSDSEL